MTRQSDDDISADELIGGIIALHRSEILDEYEKSLVQSASPAISGNVPSRMRTQAEAVLDDLHDRLLARERIRPQRDRLGATIAAVGAVGALGAGREMDPGELRWAAGVLCEAILNSIAARLPERPATTGALLRLAVVLHQSIVDRLAVGALDYLGYLLERLHRSHADERRRVAGELHDLVAHSVAVALQNLELYALHHEGDPQRAARKLDGALDALREALEAVRALTHDLRRSGAEEGMQAALNAYVASAPNADAVEVRFRGDEEHVPPAIRGELFLVLREALRNARTHGDAGRVRVGVDISPRLIRADVVDDGRGFDVAVEAGGTGLASMRERVALLGGTIVVSSAPGRGTSVHVDVALRARDDQPA
jgi:signal transduction histidine kinase